jgi:hypothetical protein
MAPSTLKAMANPPGPIDLEDLMVITERFGFQYRTLTGMLIFAVQIGRFDIAPAVSILCKYNDRPAEVHFLAAKTVMRYLCSTIDLGLIYWRPTGCKRTDLPRGDLTHFHPEADIGPLFPADLPLLEPVCFVDASYGGLLVIGEHHSITGIVIMLGGTDILAKTRIQSTMALSSTEAETMAGFDAGKIVKYMRKLFTDVRLALTGPTLVGEYNQVTILLATHRRPSGRTRHMDIQHFATQEWTQQGLIRFFKIDGKANPSDAFSKVLYRILYRRHFKHLMGYYGSPHATHTSFIKNLNNSPTSG